MITINRENWSDCIDELMPLCEQVFALVEAKITSLPLDFDNELYNELDANDLLHCIVMRDGELREIYGNRYGFKGVDDLDIGAVRARLVDDFGEDAVKKIETRANNFYEAYTGGINVADGASYITADMCKRMLRARGALTNDVAKAINILESSNKYSWMDQKDAYKLIYDKVNLVTTKYTAYGFRDHTTNGKKVSNLSVPYYNKFALFPIFDCIATGKLKNVYDKMKENKVDNLLMTSAVKVGLQGHSEFDGDTISKPLNVYT